MARDDVVVRLHEAHGGARRRGPDTAFPFVEATRTDQLERPLATAGATAVVRNEAGRQCVRLRLSRSRE